MHKPFELSNTFGKGPQGPLETSSRVSVWIAAPRPRQGPLGKPLILVSDPQHCDLGLLVIELICKVAGFLGTLMPVGGIVDGKGIGIIQLPVRLAGNSRTTTIFADDCKAPRPAVSDPTGRDLSRRTEESAGSSVVTN
jgi:hypothetical protein